MKLIVTGGYFDDSGECVLWEVDLKRERSRIFLRWTPPPHLRVPTKGFAGGTLHPNGDFFVAAHACLARIDLARAQVTGVLHQPCFNDLHHVEATKDRLYIANTGLASVDIFTLEGTFIGSHALLPSWINARRINLDTPQSWHQRERKLTWTGECPAHSMAAPGDTEPRSSYYTQTGAKLPFARQKVRDFLHINHVQIVHGHALATCLHDGSLRDLTTFEVLFRDETLHPHDGVLLRDALWLTGIDGRILELDTDTWLPRASLHVFQTGHWGWCRGLVVTEDLLIVGLTEVRAERLPRLHWSTRPPGGSETSVLAIDRRSGRLVARIDLTDPVRHSKLYTLQRIHE